MSAKKSALKGDFAEEYDMSVALLKNKIQKTDENISPIKSSVFKFSDNCPAETRESESDEFMESELSAEAMGELEDKMDSSQEVEE